MPLGEGAQRPGSKAPRSAEIAAAGRLPGVVFTLLLALVALSPLPQGGREAWSAFILIAWVGVLLMLAGLAGLVGKAAGWPVRWLPARQMRLPVALFVGVCVWAALQWMPWTPAALHHPLWADAARTLDEDLAGRISLNPERTLAALLQLLAYGGVFLLALALGRDGARARRGFQVFVYSGLGYALYGLAAFFSGSELTLWFGERGVVGALSSTFENRNSYATLAGMGLIAAFALFLDGLGAVLRARVPMRTRFGWILREVFGPGAPRLVAVLVLATALLLTASRGGTLATLFGLLVLVLSALRAGALPGRYVSALASFFLFAALLVFMLSGEHLARRLERLDPDIESRAVVYALIVDAIGDAPLLGTGYGTFPDVFPLYRDGSVLQTTRWQRAHNSYLENALELGVPAATALCVAIAACARCCWLGIRRRRRRRIYPMVGVALTATVAAHAWVDFSLQIPAVGIGYAFILGIASAQSFPSRPRT